MTSLDVFEVAARLPNSLAVVAGSTALDFAALAARVQTTAGRLQARGLLAPGPRPVALVARPSLASLEVVYALMSAGVTILFVHARLPPGERRALAERAGARALLVPDEEPLSGEAAPLAARRLVAPADPLAIIPTSGSSGEPKLVVLSRAAFTASALASQANLALAPGDRWLLCLPLAHVGGLSIVTRALLSGSAVVAFEPRNGSLLTSIDELANVLADSRVNIVSLVPALLDRLLSARPAWRPPRTLRAVLLGGAGTSPALLERALARGVPLLTTYGLTEACSQVTTTPFGSTPLTERELVSSGKPLPGIELAIDADERIRVRGPTLASGLLNGAPLRNDEGWLVTEDRGFFTAEGELVVLGRSGDVITSGGEKIDPLRVEAVLAALPNVRAAGVFGRPDPTFGQVVAAVLVTDAAFDAERSWERLKGRLAPHERPRLLATLDALPLLANGKLDRSALSRLAPERLRTWCDVGVMRRAP